MRKTLWILAALAAVAAIAVAPALAGEGCSKTKAAEAAHQAAVQGDDGQPAAGCSKLACNKALAALKTASEDKGCPKGKSAYEAAVAAVKKADASEGGCPHAHAADHQAAIKAMKSAAEEIGSPAAKAAVDAALVAMNRDETEPAD